MPRQDGVALGEDHRALDAVLQLAHVSRPAIRHQGFQGRRRQRQRLLLHVAAEAIDEVARQQGNIAGTIAQRRNRDREDRQPEEEILAEPPRGHGGTQTLVRRRHQPHVDLHRRRSADALEAPLFERAQDLGLQRERQVADLVEEERAAVRHLELARLARDGAGEGALLVAEELGFEQRLRESPRS